MSEVRAIEFDLEPFGELDNPLRGFQPLGEHHKIEYLALQPPALVDIIEPQVLGTRMDRWTQ